MLSKLIAVARLLVWKLALLAYRTPVLGLLLARLPLSVKQYLRAKLYAKAHGSGRPHSGAAGGRLRKTRVSIIIPVYNHFEFLPRCIESALSQTYRHVEVVIVDDASPDERVRELLRRYSRRNGVKVVRHEENRGVSEAQNTALSVASGDIIAFLDCDDYLARDAVEISLRYWKPDTVYSHSARINVDEDNREVSRIAFDHLPRQDYFRENLERMYATHFKMVRASALAKVGGFDSRFDAAQDYDLLMRVAFHFPSSAFAYVPHFVYFHRFHQEQATERMNRQQAEAARQIQAEARLRNQVRAGEFDRFLSIIMLSFGKHRQTLEAIKSIEKTVAIPHEIILFDNGSERSTVDFLADEVDGRFDNVRLICNSYNAGPAAGRRAALSHARGEWVLVFDNDELAQPGWIEEMIVRALSRPDVGSVSAKVVFPNGLCQFTGGYIEQVREDVVHLDLHDRDKDAYALETAVFRQCDWNPIGATLFLVNPLQWLHPGYPNVFEDAGVSLALRRQGYVLLNCPSAWVVHDHVIFNDDLDMKDQYLEARYRADDMLTSMASFYRENGLIIEDDYVWRENGLSRCSLPELRDLLKARWREKVMPALADQERVERGEQCG